MAKKILTTFLLWAVLVTLAAIISVPVAMMSEAIALQHRISAGTPGLIVAAWLVPSSPDQGLQAMAKQMDIALKVDAMAWFVIISSVAICVSAVRKRRRARS